MSRETYDFWVGIFVIIGLASLFYLTFTVSGYRPSARVSHYEVSAKFSNIGGLKLRAPVKSAGVTVGHVRAIHLDRDYMANVALSIRSDFQFPEDSALAILTSGLLGEQYIGIQPGPGIDPMLVDGGRVTRTQSAMVLEELIGQLMVSFVTRDN